MWKSKGWASTMIKNVKDSSGNAGLDMNTSKTKAMVFSKQGGTKASIKVDGEEIEQVDAMKYLGTTLTEDIEIKQR